MKIAYLINLYPKPSHAAMRREILAVEATGAQVFRYSIRRTTDELVDSADRSEAAKTTVILDAGLLGLAMASIAESLLRPVRFWRALELGVKIGLHSDRGLLRNLVYVAEACVLRRSLGRRGVQHIHAHFGTNGAAVAMLCRELGGPPYSFTVHGPYEFDFIGGLAMDRKVAGASFVVAISYFCRSQLFRWCRTQDWPKIQIVRCGLDERYLGAQAAPLPDRARFVCVGRLCEEKGQVLLVEAAARLKEMGLDFELVLVGDGSTRGEIEAQIARHRLQDYVKITGWASSDQVFDWFQSSRAVLLPSFAEGLPMVLMEGMVLGRPAISSAIAAVGELVEPGVSGWLISPSNNDQLVDAMRQVIELPKHTLAAMGAAGAEKVRQNHSMPIIATQLVALFAASILAEQGERPVGAIADPSAAST